MKNIIGIMNRDEFRRPVAIAKGECRPAPDEHKVVRQCRIHVADVEYP